MSLPGNRKEVGTSEVVAAGNCGGRRGNKEFKRVGFENLLGSDG